MSDDHGPGIIYEVRRIIAIGKVMIESSPKMCGNFFSNRLRSLPNFLKCNKNNNLNNSYHDFHNIPSGWWLLT